MVDETGHGDGSESSKDWYQVTTIVLALRKHIAKRGDSSDCIFSQFLVFTKRFGTSTLYTDFTHAIDNACLRSLVLT